ncbi:hypothetical protein [Cystobacter fuscus]|uniref:hypothetical protein n=1 Tax=Cystobacter fuscus TaxID=43 RepID=UPI002B2E34ED|nr:hypothetical protein F0U63_05670 [Cystobacter fuscus]
MKAPLPHLLSSSLSLMVAACHPGYTVPAPHSQVESVVMSLPPSAPRVEQRIVLVVAPKEGKKMRLEYASLSLDVDYSWQGLKSDTSESTPWFRVRIVDERDGSIYAERANDLDTLRPLMRIYRLDHPLCQQAEERCEVPFRIELERQGPPAQGILNVHWKATGSALVHETEVSNIEVRLRER